MSSLSPSGEDHSNILRLCLDGRESIGLENSHIIEMKLSRGQKLRWEYGNVTREPVSLYWKRGRWREEVCMTYLFFCPLGDDSEPVSYHAEDCSEVSQAHQNPEPYDRFIVVHVFYFWPTCRHGHKVRLDVEKQTASKCVFTFITSCFRTCHKIPKSNGRQGDDHEVKGLQRRPALDMFEDGCWESHKQEAAEQDEQQGGYDPDLCLTDVPVLKEGQTIYLTAHQNWLCVYKQAQDHVSSKRDSRQR